MTPEINFESPLEERTAEMLACHLHPGVVWGTQRWLKADGERFRADFFAEAGGRRVIIEADGKDFHDYQQDKVRDVKILNAGEADDVFRFNGCDVWFAPKSCLRCLELFAPFLSVPDAEPTDLEGKFFASRVFLSMEGKPIHRAVHSMSEYEALDKRLLDYQTAVVIGRTSDSRGCVSEFKTPMWNRNFEGMRVWQLGDYVAYKGTLDGWL